jgi:hypothetical protein
MFQQKWILEQWRFQPAIVRKTRVLLIASATVRFIGVAILWVPIASAPAGYGPEGVRASSALIAPAGLTDATNGVLGESDEHQLGVRAPRELDRSWPRLEGAGKGRGFCRNQLTSVESLGVIAKGSWSLSPNTVIECSPLVMVWNSGMPDF